MESEACLVAAAVFKTVERLSWSLVGSIPSLSAITYFPRFHMDWRLNIHRQGTIFEKYFSDKKYGGGRKSLKAAIDALAELKELLDSSRLVNGKLSKTTINKAKKLLASR